MSHLRKGILGAAAIAMTFGAAQFALGEDITIGMRRTAGIADQGINRTAKSDRGPILAEPVAPTRTISIHVDRVPDSSVLIRLPSAQETGSGAKPAMREPKSGESKPGTRKMIACEPIVSVLTEIAKQLQPARCLT